MRWRILKVVCIVELGMSPVFQHKDRRRCASAAGSPERILLSAIFGMEDTETWPSYIPDFIMNPPKLRLWLDETAVPAARERGQIVGPGSIPEKGLGLIMFDALIRECRFDPLSRFHVPRFTIITPDYLSAGSRFNYAEVQDSDVDDCAPRELLLRSGALQTLQELTHTSPAYRELIETGPIIVRSMSALEGGIGRSAAGALISIPVDDPGSGYLNFAAINVLASGFEPLALRLSTRYGAEPRLPGLIFQSYVTREDKVHVIFNTAVEGEVRGYYTARSGPEEAAGRFLLPPVRAFTARPTRAFACDIGQRPRLDSACELIEGAICELACLFSNHGKVAVEIEFVYDPDPHLIELVQHRFVQRAPDRAPPADLTQVCQTTAVVGCAAEAVSDFVVIRDGAQFNLESYQAVKELRDSGRPFAVIVDPITISLLSSDKSSLLRMILLEADVVLELSGGQMPHASDISAHFARLISDQSTLFMSCASESFFRIEAARYSAGSLFGQPIASIRQVEPQALSDEDKWLLAGASFSEAKSSAARCTPPLIVRLEEPLVFYGCERRGAGGIYRA